MPDSKTETGPTWTGYFPKGNIGIMPMPASLHGMANAALADSDIGVAPIAGVNGGTVHLHRRRRDRHLPDSKVSDDAWNFLAWVESDDAQINVIARHQGGMAQSFRAATLPTTSTPRQTRAS